jgi:hypothetical protein
MYGSEGGSKREQTRPTLLFFMVENSFNMLNMKPQLFLYANKVIVNNPEAESKNNNYNDGDKKPKDTYVKVLVKDPFNNRDLILKATKRQKGVYL